MTLRSGFRCRPRDFWRLPEPGGMPCPFEQRDVRVRRAKSRLRASRSAAGSVAATIANGVRARRSDGRSTSTMNRSVGWKARWRSSTASANAGFAQRAVRPSIGGPSERGGPARQDLLEAASPIRRCRSPPLQYDARKACRGLLTPMAAQCLMTCLRSLPLRLRECPQRVDFRRRPTRRQRTLASRPQTGCPYRQRWVARANRPLSDFPFGKPGRVSQRARPGSAGWARK